MRVLINEKISIIKKELKNINELKKTSTQSRSGNIISIKDILLKEKEEKEKFNQLLSDEKEIVIRKTVSLQKEASRQKIDRILMKSENHNEEINHNIKSIINRFSINSQENASSINNSNYNLENEEEKTKADELKIKIEADDIQDFLDAEEDKISQRKSTNKKLQYLDLDSDIGSKLFLDEISDCTSMTSNNSNFEFDPPFIPERISCISKNVKDDPVLDAKKMYQDFVKVILKVKFEKLHNTHKGWEIPEKILFKECIKKGIPVSDWGAFVLSELQQPQKYTQFFKTNNNLKKNRMQKNIG